MKIVYLFIFILSSIVSNAQIKGIDFSKAITNKDKAYTNLGMNELTFYKENDSTYIMSFPRNEVGFYDCLNKTAEICILNEKEFTEPDFIGGYIPENYKSESISKLYSDVISGTISILRRYNIENKLMVLICNTKAFGIAFTK